MLFHMLTDFIDCLMMYSSCEECFADSPAIELLKATSRLIGIWLLEWSIRKLVPVKEYLIICKEASVQQCI